MNSNPSEATHTVDGLLIQRIEPLGLVVSASEHNYMADKWAAERKACAHELGNMLYRFDTVISCLRQVLALDKDLPPDVVNNRCDRMLVAADSSRDLLRQLNKQIDSCTSQQISLTS